MNCNERKGKALELRQHRIVGKCVNLIPASAQHAQQIVRLRNKPRNIYFFNQEGALTLEAQKRWFALYEERNNDIYWCVYNKQEEFIGTIRLYDIDFDGRRCAEGSYIIDEDFADEAPYAVEAKMLALDAAFDDLMIQEIINENRADNKVMNNIDTQLGFDEGVIVQIRNIDYLHRVLLIEDYKRNREKFAGLIEYWSMR